MGDNGLRHGLCGGGISPIEVSLPGGAYGAAFALSAG
jgi:hypothetical protein